MNWLLNGLRFVLIAAGIVLAVAWWLHPAGHYEILLGISVAVLALVEFLRSLWEGRKKAASEREAIQASRDTNAKLDAALAAFRSAQSRAQGEPPKPATPPAPPENPSVKRFVTIIDLRQKIESLIQDYAKETKTDSSGTPYEVLSRLNMPTSFRDGTKLFLDQTNDLAQQPEAMLDWAAENGKTYIGALELMIENARRPAP